MYFVNYFFLIRNKKASFCLQAKMIFLGKIHASIPRWGVATVVCVHSLTATSIESIEMIYWMSWTSIRSSGPSLSTTSRSLIICDV